MARPKKSHQEEKATVKMESAFWSLLKTKGYGYITVSGIVRESRVNRNSFYYHYRDIDDLAYIAFKNTMESEAAGKLISALLAAFQSKAGESFVSFDQSVLSCSERVILCAGSGSEYLTRLVTNFLKKVWFDAFSIHEERLSAEEKLQVNFIFAGLVAILGSQEIKESPSSMSILSQTDIGKAIISILQKIAASQGN